MLEFTQSSKKPTNKIYSWESTYILIQKKRVTNKVTLSLSCGEYQSRTGDLLTASQAL